MSLVGGGNVAKLSEKQAVVAEVAEKLKNSQGIVLADYRGLNVSQVTKLRKKLREAGVEYKVIKNTLTSLAAKEAGLEDLEQFLSGPTAIAFGLEDPVVAAKVLTEFAKDHKALELKGGVVDGKVIGLDEVKALADLPSREVLLSMVLRGFQAPLYGMANVLQGNIRNLAYVLEGVRKKQEEAQA